MAGDQSRARCIPGVRQEERTILVVQGPKLFGPPATFCGPRVSPSNRRFAPEIELAGFEGSGNCTSTAFAPTEPVTIPIASMRNCPRSETP